MISSHCQEVYLWAKLCFCRQPLKCPWGEDCQSARSCANLGVTQLQGWTKVQSRQACYFFYFFFEPWTHLTRRFSKQNGISFQGGVRGDQWSGVRYNISRAVGHRASQISFGGKRSQRKWEGSHLRAAWFVLVGHSVLKFSFFTWRLFPLGLHLSYRVR